jgi:hypothetical protein
MEVLEQVTTRPQGPERIFAPAPPVAQTPSSAVAETLAPADAERAARRALRAQIGRLERELSDAFVTAFEMGGVEFATGSAPAAARMLDFAELEHVRDSLVERLRDARGRITQRAEEQAASRLALEQMLLEPGKHRFERVACSDLGQPGCGVWEVRPRLGLIGMLMGWWQVKLSSGCPLAEGRGRPPVTRASEGGDRPPVTAASERGRCRVHEPARCRLQAA